jgi:hypothetical protein
LWNAARSGQVDVGIPGIVPTLTRRLTTPAEAVERVAAGIDGRRWVDGCVSWKVCHLDHEVLALGRGGDMDASHGSCQLEAGEYQRADSVPPSERFQVVDTDLSASDAVAEERDADRYADPRSSVPAPPG